MRIRRGLVFDAREEGHEEGFKEAEAKYQEQLAARDERIRQLEEEARRLREGR
jgi:flagellar biosynthesis/type III secretory pathway protein FliH